MFALNSRGIAAAPLQTGFCAHFDWNSATQKLDEELNLTDPVEAAEEATNETDFDGASSVSAVKSNSVQQRGSTVSAYEYHSSKRSAAFSATPTNALSPIGFIKEHCEHIKSDSVRGSADSEPPPPLTTSTDRTLDVNMNSQQQMNGWKEKNKKQEDGNQAAFLPTAAQAVSAKEKSVSKGSTLNWISADRGTPDLPKSAGRRVQGQWMGNLVMLGFTMLCRLVDDLFA